ncbi:MULTISPECIES: GIY-YIG nuclease family protein [Methylorubrum]|uniref:GIY-YIG nuclease family protein n=1 Tax=Methylorubrum TaxID=2282523 RepID=UPI00209ECED9|nr:MULTISPECIES: GIY-YIG nuclease family protein [Methylorubrum]MCP1550689.1 hypothetical protein [Methylorubrum zatmanii]MCP1552698.1 hypothetical protein [Methylorubrum extorquens]MCP1580992.1 hypothetical protein [Methylorubrum extorquens]
MSRKRGARAGRGAKRRAAKLIALLDVPQPESIIELTAWTGVDGDVPPGFYVYRLVDPSNGETFYVGKGQRSRAWHHERLVRAGRSAGNPAKCARISQILAADSRVIVEVEAAYTLESDALEHEWRLIDGMPRLTNLMPGGIGAAQTPEQITRRQIVRDKKLALARSREREHARLREIERNAARLQGAATPPVLDWVDALRGTKERLRYTRRRSGRQSRQELDAFRASKPTM